MLGALDLIHRGAHQTARLLRAGDLTGFGRLLRESWQAKKRLARGITNSRLDEVYDVALAHGAVGGKVAGAGGGGFLLLYCEEQHQDAVTTALEGRGLMRADFHFERGGAVVLMDALPRVRPFGSADSALAAISAPAAA